MSEKTEFEEQLQRLEKHKKQLLHGCDVAERFLVNTEKRLEEIDEQILVIRQFLGLETFENALPKYEIVEDLVPSSLAAMHSRLGETARRGAIPAKEKKKLLEEAEIEREAEKEKRRSDGVGRPQRPQDPKQPQRPGENTQPPQPEQQKPLTAEERMANIRQKLKQRDPRKMKEGLEELKKPENKDLHPITDREFSKELKEAEKTVTKYDKIKDSLRKNLKSLMQSSSDVVKGRIADLRAGKIGAGIVGLQEISNSSSFGNEVAGCAKNVVNAVKELYKEFDIKPEEAITKELLEESRPYFTRQMSEKSKHDRDIDLHSRQNILWGDTKEITDEEREMLKKIKEVTGTDKLPSVVKKDDMGLIKELITEIAKNPQGKAPIATMIAKGKDDR